VIIYIPYKLDKAKLPAIETTQFYSAY